MINKIVKAIVIVITVFPLFCGTRTVIAHCDGMDGPVIKAAQKALETAKVDHVLIWVPEKDEKEIKDVFQKTLSVRKLSEESKALADMYFFETLVRIHRAGEGVPYTGLKPAGRNLGPVIPEADKAIETGSVSALAKKIDQAAEEAMRERFARLMKAKEHKDESIKAGREYVEAYVAFVHFVEGLHNIITHGGAHDEH